MNVVLLDGVGKNDAICVDVSSYITDALRDKGHTVERVVLRDKEIANCLGCFGCWTKTPGICVIDDDGRSVTRSIMESDFFILLSPITFGGYSYELKKALDRIIPVLSPFFQIVDGETHHYPRYRRYPKELAIGILREPDDELADLFKQLVGRNTRNMYDAVYTGIVPAYGSPGETRSVVVKLIEDAGL